MKYLQLNAKGTWFCILSASFFFLLSQDIGHSEVETEGQDFVKQLTELENLIAFGVPEIHSVEYCNRIEGPGKKAICENGTDWAIKFAMHVYECQKGLNDLPWEQFKTSVGKLSEFRNRIAKEPIYGNCLLASYIDRVVQQWLLQRLIVNEDNLGELKKLPQISHRYFPFKTLMQMLEKEYGKKVVDYKKFEKLPEDEQGVELGALTDKLMGFTHPEDFSLGSPYFADPLQVLDAQGAIFNIAMQTLSNIILDYLILFKERNGAFPEDEEEFMSALEKTVPEIQKITPETGEPIYSGGLWLTYKKVKEKGLDALRIPGVEDTTDYSKLDE